MFGIYTQIEREIMNTRFYSVLWDIVAGVVVALISYFILEEFELKIAFMLISPLPVIAGFIRGKSPAINRFGKIARMNLLFFVLFLAIVNGVFYLILILAVALIGTALGIYIRLKLPGSTYKSMGFLVLFFGSVLLSGFIVLPAWLDSMMWKEVNYQAPEFELLSLEGDTVSSLDYRNTVMILDFWGTWCGPCIEQFPLLEKLYKEYEGNHNITFFIINPQVGGDTFEKALNFINENEYDLPFMNDIESMTYKNFNVYSLPRLIIIDKEGQVRFSHKGYNQSDNFYKIFHKHVDGLLNQP